MSSSSMKYICWLGNRSIKSAVVASLLLLCLLTTSVQFTAPEANAEIKSKISRGNPEFQIPERLRPRVNFWIDIFGRYTKAQVVIHHRRYPQIRFALLDIEAQTAGMNDVAFDAYKSRALKDKLREVREDIAYLAKGNPARTSQQKDIERSMQALGKGLSKYQQIVADGELVRGQSGIVEKTAAAIKRSGRYLPIIEEIFVGEFGLPVELTRLPFVESSFDYRAFSSAAAAGIWQFMPKTARSFMRVTAVLDERLDPIEATRGAAKYFRSAYARLGTWPLALTSYNHGVAGVLNKVRSFGTTDISSLIESSAEPPPFGFASSNFYPSFLAAKEIYEHRTEYFPGVVPEPALRLAMITLSRPIFVHEVIRSIGVSEDELRRSNYSLSERIWSNKATIPLGYNLKVPEVYEARLMKAGFGTKSDNFEVDTSPPPQPDIFKIMDGSTKSKNVDKGEPKNGESVTTRYKVRPGDTLYSIARQFSVTPEAIKSANKIKNSSVYVGKVLAIPAASGSQDSDSSTSKSSKAKPAQKEPLVKLYTVRKGDTLGSIAKRLNISLAKLASANSLSAKNPKIKPGQVLRIPS